jgi:chromate transporter
MSREGSGEPTRLRELALVFLTLGAIGFGGPAAHVALMEDELVRRRRWLSRERFLDLLGASNLIPGPNSTELAIHIGRERAGWRGLLVAGACFILPAACSVLACAWAYARFGALPAAQGLLYGVKPVMLAAIVQASWTLGRSALGDARRALAGTAALAAALLGVHELAVLLAAGTLLGLWARRPGAPAAPAVVVASVAEKPHAVSLALPTALAATPLTVGLWPLFLVFLKTGSVLFGSGYVLLAYLRADLVVRHGWLTDAQLLDAVSVGQLTPGPVLTTATFVGYLLAGTPGAVVATAGIFLPAFVLVGLSGPLVPRLRRSATAAGFLDGVNSASVALMGLAAALLARAAVVDLTTGALALVAAVLLLRFNVAPAWLVPASGLVGLLARWLS